MLYPPCAQMKVVALLFAFLAVATGFASPPSKDDPTIPGRTTYSGGTCDNCNGVGCLCFLGTCSPAMPGADCGGGGAGGPGAAAAARRRSGTSTTTGGATACTTDDDCDSGQTCSTFFGTCGGGGAF